LGKQKTGRKTMTMQDILGRAERKKLDDAEFLGVLTSAELPCASCEGKGEVVRLEWLKWNDAFDKAKSTTKSVRLAMEQAGPQPESPEVEMCEECKGLKFLPTENGMRLLAFLARHGIQKP
jgi:hypothetical protein